MFLSYWEGFSKRVTGGGSAVWILVWGMCGNAQPRKDSHFLSYTSSWKTWQLKCKYWRGQVDFWVRQQHAFCSTTMAWIQAQKPFLVFSPFLFPSASPEGRTQAAATVQPLSWRKKTKEEEFLAAGKIALLAVLRWYCPILRLHAVVHWQNYIQHSSYSQ